MNLQTTAAAVANAYARRARQWNGAKRDGLRRIVLFAEGKYVENLSGGGDAAPGSYPVPIRRGTLRRGSGTRVLQNDAYLFNNTRYARAVEKGSYPYGNRRAKFRPGRPAMEDALKATPSQEIMLTSLRRGLA